MSLRMWLPALFAKGVSRGRQRVNSARLRLSAFSQAYTANPFRVLDISEMNSLGPRNPDSSPVVFILRDARGMGAQGVFSRSRVARVAQQEDDWGRVNLVTRVGSTAAKYSDA